MSAVSRRPGPPPAPPCGLGAVWPPVSLSWQQMCSRNICCLLVVRRFLKIWTPPLLTEGILPIMLSVSPSAKHVLINYLSLPHKNIQFPEMRSLGDDALINSKPFKIKCLFSCAPQSLFRIVPRSIISVNSGFWNNDTSSFVSPLPPSLPLCVGSARPRLCRPLSSCVSRRR